MKNPDRQKVYDAMDNLPDLMFSALLMAASGVNKVLAVTVADDPTPNSKLEEAMQPFLTKLGG